VEAKLGEVASNDEPVDPRSEAGGRLRGARAAGALMADKPSIGLLELPPQDERSYHAELYRGAGLRIGRERGQPVAELRRLAEEPGRDPALDRPRKPGARLLGRAELVIARAEERRVRVRRFGHRIEQRPVQAV